MSKTGRNANINTRDDDGRMSSWDTVKVEAMYDIRDRLDRILRVLECHNALRIPSVLDTIAKNTKKPKRRTKK